MSRACRSASSVKSVDVYGSVCKLPGFLVHVGHYHTWSYISLNLALGYAIDMSASNICTIHAHLHLHSHPLLRPSSTYGKSCRVCQIRQYKFSKAKRSWGGSVCHPVIHDLSHHLVSHAIQAQHLVQAQRSMDGCPLQTALGPQFMCNASKPCMQA